MTLRTATVLTSPVRGVCLVVGSLIRSQPIIAFDMCSELAHATCETRPKVCTPAKVAGRSCHGDTIVCCFVLLEPTWMLYRVPRVSPGVTAPICHTVCVCVLLCFIRTDVDVV